MTTVVVALAVLAAGAWAYVRAGLYDVSADAPHHPATFAALEEIRRASIARRARALEVPADLASPARITQGAGNYDAMCTGCHLAPGIGPTELSRGLYPAPPNLATTRVDVAEAFWTIKHGIKGSGMPAWGASMSDEYIWNMAAFVQQLPRLDAGAYRAMVARSGGHSHGGGESDMPAMRPGDGTTADDHHAAPHEHAPGTPPHDDGAPGARMHDAGVPAPADTPAPHVDPPGTPPHHHDAPGAPKHSH